MASGGVMSIRYPDIFPIVTLWFRGGSMEIWHDKRDIIIDT